MKNMTLICALETMKKTAQNKLDIAISKNKIWDIEHYTNDLIFINYEINIVCNKPIKV